MCPLGIILGLIVAVHITAQPIDGDHSSLVQDITLDYRTAVEIFKRDQSKVQPRQETIPFPFPTISSSATTTSSQTTSSPTPTEEATQSCHATDHGAFASYSVWIGVPYGGSKPCDTTYNYLENGGAPMPNSAYASEAVLISNWQCVEMNGDTQLWFNAAPGQSASINAALQASYPSVDEFNCPDH